MKVSQEALIELISRAIQGEIRRQGELYELEEGVEDLNRLRMSTGASVDLPLVSKAVLDAIRDKVKEEAAGVAERRVDLLARLDGANADQRRMEAAHIAAAIRQIGE
ncbi:hypothetical protein OOT33_13835 [Sphingobium sp. DEHP117]|uniref:hypothetical protein n=1 Tax=Sphingobium sp. DEHP117 TaxID=2993436 RepID=UPI0027D62558|nr:hypothetical protein [Sphingobium sp. DEHP117]MDQ4421504.1 hypothetical protein [Sphingobium sp. DEHP117]